MVKAHPASVKVILVLFSDRENLLLSTLDGHRVHSKQAQPLCFAPPCDILLRLRQWEPELCT